MKYLFLVLLVSCSTLKSNCEVVETGKVLNETFDILKCSRIPICENGDLDCLNSTRCIQEKNSEGKYTCVRRQ